MIRFDLVTLDGTKFGKEVHEVMVPTPDGIIAVFEHHAPLVSLVQSGVISVRNKAGDSDNDLEHFAVHGGAVEIEDNTVRVLADEAEHTDELNEAEAQKALERAKQMLKDAKSPVELSQAQSLITQQTVRLKVAGLRRHRKSRY
jgi:F-type H+-transporting ATPase subunit epsilon